MFRANLQLESETPGVVLSQDEGRLVRSMGSTTEANSGHV